MPEAAVNQRRGRRVPGCGGESGHTAGRWRCRERPWGWRSRDGCSRGGGGGGGDETTTTTPAAHQAWPIRGAREGEGVGGRRWVGTGTAGRRGPRDSDRVHGAAAGWRRRPEWHARTRAGGRGGSGAGRLPRGRSRSSASGGVEEVGFDWGGTAGGTRLVQARMRPRGRHRGGAQWGAAPRPAANALGRGRCCALPKQPP